MSSAVHGVQDLLYSWSNENPRLCAGLIQVANCLLSLVVRTRSIVEPLHNFEQNQRQH
jgi:hypothetical protein